MTDNYSGSSREALDVIRSIAVRDRLISQMRTMLTDAAVMLEEIERNRQMPPFAAILQQYVKLGREIRAFLNDEKESK